MAKIRYFNKNNVDPSLEILENLINNLQFKNENDSLETRKIYEDNVNSMISLLENNSSLLVIGSVQSGKTNNLIYLTSKLTKKYNLDVIIYLTTGKLNIINDQNHERFSNAFNKDKKYFLELGKKVEYFDFSKEKLNNRTLIVSMIKNPYKLEQLINKLEESDAKFLIINDEGDEASLSEKEIYLMKELSLLKNFQKMITITASPYENFLHHYDEKFILKNSKNYVGIEKFSYENILEKNNEENLKEIIKEWAFFNINKNKSQLLININLKTKIHQEIANDVKKIIDEWIIFEGLNNFKNENEIISFLKNIVQTKYIYQSNSHNKFNNNYNNHQIIIGGHNLSRGITFENLTHEYITMSGKKIKAATLLQRARWCGYRKNPNDIKIYTDEKTSIALKELIHLEKWTKKYNIKDNNYEKKFKEKKYEFITLK